MWKKGIIDVIDGAFVILAKNGLREQLPIGGIACLMLEPGTHISHAAVCLSAQVGTLLVCVGKAGVRLYSSGQPGVARSDRLLWQAKLALDDAARLKIVHKIYELRIKEKPPERRSIEQLRGIEGAQVRTLYGLMAKRFGVKWFEKSIFFRCAVLHFCKTECFHYLLRNNYSLDVLPLVLVLSCIKVKWLRMLSCSK